MKKINLSSFLVPFPIMDRELFEKLKYMGFITQTNLREETNILIQKAEVNPFNREVRQQQLKEKLSNIKKGIVIDNIEGKRKHTTIYFKENVDIILEKGYGGRVAQLGETRVWGGKTYTKTGPSKWEYTGKHVKGGKAAETTKEGKPYGADPTKLSVKELKEFVDKYTKASKKEGFNEHGKKLLAKYKSEIDSRTEKYKKVFSKKFEGSELEKIKKIPNFSKLDFYTAQNFLKLIEGKSISPDRITIKESSRSNGALIILVDGKDFLGRSFYSSLYDQQQYPQSKATITKDDESNDPAEKQFRATYSKEEAKKYAEGEEPTPKREEADIKVKLEIAKRKFAEFDEHDSIVAKEFYSKNIAPLEKLLKEPKKRIKPVDYYNSFSSAVQDARAEAEQRGYEINDDDWFREVNTGPGRPKNGSTTRMSIGLSKNGKESKQMLHIQVYDRGTKTNPYELNYYIS